MLTKESKGEATRMTCKAEQILASYSDKVKGDEGLAEFIGRMKLGTDLMIMAGHPPMVVELFQLGVVDVVNAVVRREEMEEGDED